MDYGKLKVTLKSSLLVREEGPRYVIHGTKGSFVKYGLDVQEDHLKAGLMPRMEGFGIEPKQNWGILNTEIGGQHFKGHIETEAGNWDLLFSESARCHNGRQRTQHQTRTSFGANSSD
ncbi:MAG: Gfo/Idh/MocA family oxidoreductase [Emticicia sp.]|nr:Gfo/Idh/MocA family oxidoreductase [Emticicia sp.]